MTASTDAPSPQDLLRNNGLRVTRPRAAVLLEVMEHPHAGVDEIAAGVRRRLRSVSTQAVYDILRTLTDHDILRRMEPAGEPARYEVTPADNHQHLVCRRCSQIVDIHLAVPAQAELPDGQAHGFTIHHVEVTFWGTCPRCALAATDTPTE